MTARCQRIIGGRKCGLKALARLDGKALCSQHIYQALAKKQAA